MTVCAQSTICKFEEAGEGLECTRVQVINIQFPQ